MASPAITKPKTKNQKLVRRAPVHETSFQTVKQSPAVLQTTSPQPHLSSPGIEWYNSGDTRASISDYQDAQWLALEESLLRDVLALQERHFSCLSPHCTFRAHSIQELNNHHQVHPNFRQNTNPEDIQIGVQEQYAQQPMSFMQTQPLQTLAATRPLDTRLAVSLSSSPSQLSSSVSSSDGLSTSSSASSQGLSASSQATVDRAIASSSSRGVNGAFPRPPMVRRDPGDRTIVSSVRDDDPGVIHRQPAEMPLSVSSLQPAGVVGGVLHDLHGRGLVANIIQPLEKPASKIGNLVDQDGRPLELISRAKGHPRMERSLSWQTSVNAGTMRSSPTTYQLTPENFSAALTMIAAMQMLVAIFSSAVRIMHNLSVVSRQLLSFTSSFAVGQRPSRGFMMQMV